MIVAHSTSIWAVRIMRRRHGARATVVSRLDDPLALGLHPAADGPPVPPFVPRDRLPDLLDALDRGGFVLVVGDPLAGKTRLAYEAMRAALPRHRCVVPGDPGSLPEPPGGPSVLWLDDLGRYLGTLTTADLDRADTVVLATMRTADRDRWRHHHDAVGDHVDRAPGRAVLAAVTEEIHLDRVWSGPELAAAAHAPDARVVRAAAAAGRQGIAEQLATPADPPPGHTIAAAWQAAHAGDHAFLRAALEKHLAHQDYTAAATCASFLGAAGFDVAGTFAEIAAADLPVAERLDLRLRQVWRTGATVDGRGDPERAAELARQLVRDCTELLGPTAPMTLRGRIALVRNTSDLEGARALVADVTTHLGPAHDITLAARFEEACQARDAEGPRVAVRLYYDLLADLDTLGAVSPTLYVDTQWHLGSALLAAGEVESACDVLEVALDNALLCHGQDHGTTVEIRLSHIAALDAARRHDEALDLAERLAADAERVLGPDHPTTSDTRFAVADIAARRA
jgi:hypothetical protein